MADIDIFFLLFLTIGPAIIVAEINIPNEKKLLKNLLMIVFVLWVATIMIVLPHTLSCNEWDCVGPY